MILNYVNGVFVKPICLITGFSLVAHCFNSLDFYGACIMSTSQVNAHVSPDCNYIEM